MQKAALAWQTCATNRYRPARHAGPGLAGAILVMRWSSGGWEVRRACGRVLRRGTQKRPTC